MIPSLLGGFLMPPWKIPHLITMVVVSESVRRLHGVLTQSFIGIGKVFDIFRIHHVLGAFRIASKFSVPAHTRTTSRKSRSARLIVST